jgi:hypothetical protein
MLMVVNGKMYMKETKITHYMCLGNFLGKKLQLFIKCALETF